MPFMKAIRRSLSPKRDNDGGFSQMQSPAQSSFDDSENDVAVVEYERNEMKEVLRQGRGSQIKKLKKILKRKPTHIGLYKGLSKGLSSKNDSNFDGSFQECFRISVLDEDSQYEDDTVQSRSSKWQGGSCTLKPTSIDHLDALLDDSYSESEDEISTKRESTIRTQIDQALSGLDDSTHPIPSLAPPTLSHLSTSGNVSTTATLQIYEPSVQKGIIRTRKSSMVTHVQQLPVAKAGGSFSNEGKYSYNHCGSDRTSRSSHFTPLDLIESSMTSRASTIRSKIEASLDASSTHEMQNIGPQHDESQMGSSKDRQQSLLQSKASAKTKISSQKEKKAHGATSKLRDSRPRSGKSKSPSSIRMHSSKSPNRLKSSTQMLDQITSPEVSTLDPTSCDSRKPLPPPGDSKREQRFAIRRTVSSPVTSRKSPSSNSIESTTRAQRSVVPPPGESKREQRFSIRRTVSSPVTSRKSPSSNPIERTIRAQRTVDMKEVGEEGKKGKGKSSRGRRTLSIDMTGEVENSLTSWGDRLTLSINSGEESLKVIGKPPHNSSTNLDPHCRTQKKAQDDQSRTQKKDIARKKSKSPKGKKSAKVNRADDGNIKGNRIESYPEKGKSLSLSPSILAEKKKGASQRENVLPEETAGSLVVRQDPQRMQEPLDS